MNRPLSFSTTGELLDELEHRARLHPAQDAAQMLTDRVQYTRASMLKMGLNLDHCPADPESIPSSYQQPRPPFFLRCFFGWHAWTWKLARDPDDDERTIPLDLSAPPPPSAICSRCGIKHG